MGLNKSVGDRFDRKVTGSMVAHFKLGSKLIFADFYPLQGRIFSIIFNFNQFFSLGVIFNLRKLNVRICVNVPEEVKVR